MHMVRRVWCRAYQTVFRIALPVLPYTEPHILKHAEDVAPVLQECGVQSVLIVTDPGIARLGLTSSLEAALAQAGIDCTVYANTQANPTVSNVEEAAVLYRENGCRAIVGFGGGSAMDCAKGVGARIAQPRKPINKMRGLLRVHRRLPLLIAVPTTAGTGSEVTLAAVITDDKTHYKYPINDFVLIPRYAVHDPRLTCGLPASITGQTGMDALTHAVEAYIGRSTNTYTREAAKRAVRLIHDNLLEAYENGQNIEARANMLEAAYQAGIAFTRSYVGYVHGIAHSLGGRYGISHGLANAVILPHMLRAYGPVAERKLAELARDAGIAPATANDQTGAQAFIEWVDDMNARLGIPRYLDGINAVDVPAMAAHAAAESNPLYPVAKLMDAEELARMYRVVAGGHFADEPAVHAGEGQRRSTERPSRIARTAERKVAAWSSKK